MIFSVNKHIEQIINGTKTQTRRTSERYQIGKTYAIQPSRTAKGIDEGRIIILKKKFENCLNPIDVEDAKAEGGYSQAQFENLYDEIHPNWMVRWAYTFKFLPRIRD